MDAPNTSVLRWIKKYLQEGRAMQLATARDDRPWICSVYFVTDDNERIYWLSYPERRHSKELASNNAAAITVAVKIDQPVVGLQAEGRVSEVRAKETVRKIMDRYIQKYGVGNQFYENFLDGTNKHRMYVFEPESITLFDELNFPDQPQHIRYTRQ